MNKCLLISVLSLLAFPAYADVESFVNAAKVSDVKQVRELLKAGENVNAKNSLGNTALHYAVASGNSDMVKFLLDKGADVTVANDKGWTPLAIAEKKNLSEIIKMLQSTQDNKELTALVQQASETAKKAEQKVSETKQNVQKITNSVQKNAKTKISDAKAEVAQAEQKLERKTERVEQKVQDKAAEVKKDAKENLSAIAAKTEKAVQKTENTAKEIVKETSKASKTEIKNQEIRPEVKTKISSAPKSQSARVIKPVASKPLYKPVPSKINKDIFAGDEEIVYCLYYLGLQTDQHNLTYASEFFAGNTMEKKRFDKIADFARRYYDNASEAEMQDRADVCSKVITPKDSYKQNQIIHAINKAIGY